MVPKARGAASRLLQESEGYRSRVVANAEGEASRFSKILTEYQKAPGITRDRMYIDAMQQIYSNVTKVVVDSKQGSNLMYLPLDKLMQMTASGAPLPSPAQESSNTTAPAPASTNGAAADPRSRESLRSRDRDAR